MKNIYGIILGVFFIFLGTLSAFAEGEWRQGEDRYRNFGDETLTVNFGGVAEGKCVISVLVVQSKNLKFAEIYGFNENSPVGEVVSIDGKERKLFFVCAEGQLAFFIDDERLTGK